MDYNRYCDASLLECDHSEGGFYYAIEADEESARVMSTAAHEVVERVTAKWMERPGVVCCHFDINDAEIEISINSPNDDIDSFARFRLPLDELMISAAMTAEDWVRRSPSDVSAILRKLADEIDAAAGQD
ncbi:MAG: hypothetical protein RI988_2028 [Pseudomonadota bacterium]|jgi:hypothetical protein